MYVKEIRLQNFQSYYGNDNVLEFAEGLNVVIGSINKGKSKLFDAFYWVLFGEIFITGGTWVNTNSLPAKSSFINDRARFLAEPGDTVDTSVELILCHQEPDQLPVDYTFCRTVSATRRTDATVPWHDERAWQVSNSRVEMRYTKDYNLEIIDTQVGFDEELRKLFPREIRNYVWFQGEALDKLIDFSNRKTFEDAIKHISYFPRYEKLAELIEQATDIIERERNKKVKETTSDKKQFEDRERELDQKKTELKQLQTELKKLETQRDEARQLKDDAEGKLNALHEFPPLEKRQARAEADLKIAKSQINAETDRQKENFQKTWLLKGMSGLMEEAKQRMQDYENQRNSNAKYVLPAEVPPKHYMEKMLSEGQCLICGTDAPAGSSPHMHIQQRIDAQQAYYKQSEENLELYGSVKQLLSFPDEVEATASGITEQIDTAEDRIEAAMKKRNEANTEFLDVQAAINSLIGKYHVSLSEGAAQSKTQMSKLTSMNQIFSDTNVQIERKKQAIITQEAAIGILQAKLNTTGSNGTGNIPEKRWHELATFMNGVVRKVKDRAKVDMIGLIEQRANTYYSSITKHNRAVDGKISIDKTSYKITRTENDEYTVASGNTGNFTLMKMCIINAMLNLNEEVAGTSYPFIADAPTSNLDDETTIAYLKSLAPSFGQSIIITKDISQFRFTEVKSDNSVRTIHVLETYTADPNAERLTQYEAYTKIKRIK